MFEINPPILAAPIVLIVAAVCCAAGNQILRWFGADDGSWPARAAFGCAIGLGVLSYLVLAIGLAGWLSTASVSVVMGVVTVLGAIFVVGRVRNPGPGNRSLATDEGGSTALDIGLLAVLGAAAVLTLVGSLAPPVSDDWDGLAYHLADPAIYLERGRISPIWFESHSNFPFTVEMLYVVGLALKSVSVAKGFSWILWGIGTLAVYGLARDLANGPARRRAGLLAAAVFAAAPIVLWEATSSYVDVASAAFLVLSAHGLLLWRRSGGWGWLVAGALCGGWALGTKMTLFLPVMLLGLCALWWSQGSGARRIGQALAFLGIALAVASPWYIKSYVWTGNPVYPFFYSVFDGRNWSAEHEEAYKGQQSSFGHSDRGLGRLVTAPWDTAVSPSTYYDKVSSSPAVVYLFSLGMLFVASLPILALGLRWDKETLGLLAVVAIGFGVWFFQVQYLRYLIPLVGVVAALIGASAAGALGVGGKGRAAALVFCGFVFAVSAFHVGLLAHSVAADRFGVALGLQAQQDYLSSRLAVYPMVEFINTELPSDSRIIMYHEVFGLYLEREYMWGNPQHHTLIPYETFETMDDLQSGLRTQGVTHVLVNERFMPTYESAEDWMRLLYEGIWAGQVVPVYSERGYTLFELAEG